LSRQLILIDGPEAKDMGGLLTTGLN
jgi:hypothetical protein